MNCHINDEPPRRLARPRRWAIAGITIVEVMVAAGVVVIGFAGLFPLSVQSLSMLRIQSELAKATQVLQEQTDSLRAQTWGTLTNSVNYTNYNYTVVDADTGVSTTVPWTGLLNTLPTAASGLNNPVETLTVSAFQPSGTPPTPFVVKNNNGTVTVTPTGGSDLSGLSMVRVDIRLQWTESRSNRAHSQETSFVVSSEGVGK
jgi:type II secretory pathway pseudopilin PulG